MRNRVHNMLIENKGKNTSMMKTPSLNEAEIKSRKSREKQNLFLEFRLPLPLTAIL